ncbi:hypothetical protein OZ410_00060 [Robiginitalea sp. M366]|uniref:hypothetical protein n=1 Tax=Robiginitalea aestuariiviva TaxID=3036903 RepID=UPI00240CEBC8|nr:hypothetical protein [Robiginitalea aestuariiviva]MDG1570693.1 hypothetical protein [Robiginitalea aestuariiviva]
MDEKAKPQRSSFLQRLACHLRATGYTYFFDTLVVILGILIAFSLDNAYNRSQRDALMQSYARSLISDLEDDLLELRDIMGHMRESIRRIDSLANYTRHRSIDQLDNLDLFPLAMGDNPYRPYSFNRITLEDLKQSGILRMPENEILSRKLAEYEAFTRHLEEDYYYDLRAREQVSVLSDGILNLNYSDFGHLAPNYANHNKHILEYHFNQTDDYARAQSDGLSLLTHDINEVRKMVNGYLRLRFFLNIRGNAELPRLIRQGEELIVLLKSDYL